MQIYGQSGVCLCVFVLQQPGGVQGVSAAGFKSHTHTNIHAMGVPLSPPPLRDPSPKRKKQTRLACYPVCEGFSRNGCQWLLVS